MQVRCALLHFGKRPASASLLIHARQPRARASKNWLHCALFWLINSYLATQTNNNNRDFIPVVVEKRCLLDATHPASVFVGCRTVDRKAHLSYTSL
jgi:hypothetical protein